VKEKSLLLRITLISVSVLKLYPGHKIDTLGGVFCFLGCPRIPSSQTGCPRGHPKILQGCPFYTQKKFRVSPVLVGPMALNFLLINFFSKKVKKNQTRPARTLHGTLHGCKVIAQAYVVKVIESLQQRFLDLKLFNAAKLFSPVCFSTDLTLPH
jgi:hypothetical protein